MLAVGGHEAGGQGLSSTGSRSTIRSWARSRSAAGTRSTPSATRRRKFLEKEIAPLADWAIWHALISPRSWNSTARPPSRWATAPIWSAWSWTTPAGCRPTSAKRRWRRRRCAPWSPRSTLPDGATLESGKARMEIGQLEGRAYKARRALRLGGRPHRGARQDRVGRPRQPRRDRPTRRPPRTRRHRPHRSHAFLKGRPS